MPIPLLPKVKEKLETLVSMGVIERVEDPTEWCSPLVTVPKFDNDIRICVDLTSLNRSVKRELHPMPVVEHTLGMLNGAKVFSKLDANSGFYQIPLSVDSQRLTTFITPFGRFCYRRLPFGITSAPEHFQRRMEKILEGLPGIAIHMDDVLISGLTIAEHDERLRAALKKIRDSGHIIDVEGVKPDPQKIKAVAEMPPPKSVTEVRSFLGMVNYLGRFVPNLSTKAKSLSDLLCKKNEFVWGPSQQRAFVEIKFALTSSPLLALYNSNFETFILSDASSFGLGAVLLQKQEDGELKPVAYASRTLTSAEIRYAQIEKEALGIAWACERFRDFIMGKTFEIETDHKPLLQVLQTKSLDDHSCRLQRLRIRLMRYSYSMKFVPGKLLATADILSRQPLMEAEGIDFKNEISAFVCHVLSYLPVSDEGLSEIVNFQQEDAMLRRVHKYCISEWPEKCNDLLKPYWNVRDSLSIQNGILMMDNRLVIPPKLRNDILGRIHDGHLGIVKCRARARESCWWPGISMDIAEVVNRCHVCVKQRIERKEPLMPTDFPTRPWQHLAMNLFKLKGKWFMVVVDFYSRYPEVGTLKNLSTKEVIYFLKQIFSRHGIPEQVRSDNGTQFHPVKTSEFQKFAREYGFIHTTTSPHFPQSNGFAENAVKIVKRLLSKNADPFKTLLIYRSTSLANAYSLAELLMGRRIRTTLPVPSSSLIPIAVDRSDLEEKEGKRINRQKRNFNNHHGVIEKLEFKPGEIVWVKDRRSWGKILGKADTPRSFRVNTPAGEFRRNSSALTRAFTEETPEEFFEPVSGENEEPENVEPVANGFFHQQPEEHRFHSAPIPPRAPSGRVRKPTRRLIEEI